MKGTVTIANWNTETGTYDVEHVEYESKPGRTDPVRTTNQKEPK